VRAKITSSIKMQKPNAHYKCQNPKSSLEWKKQQLASVYSKSCKILWFREGKNGNVSKIDATKTNLLQSKIVVNIAL
jgi:hypothetical protein